VRGGDTGRATILHADLDAFYASVEQRDDPRLRGRPVIVGGGVVLAASYEAKTRGVRTAMNGRQARALCPDARVVPPRMAAYSEASAAVFAVFRDTTTLVEGISIDEAFLEVGGLHRIAGSPEEIAVRLRREVAARVGLAITVGVARTKFLAKVASGVAKPDGLLVVPPEGEQAFLHPLRVERLWGVACTPWPTWPTWGSRPWCRFWGVRPAGTCTRSRTTGTRARWRRGGDAVRSARSVRSGEATAAPRSSTRSWRGPSTGWPGGCAAAVG